MHGSPAPCVLSPSIKRTWWEMMQETTSSPQEGWVTGTPQPTCCPGGPCCGHLIIPPSHARSPDSRPGVTLYTLIPPPLATEIHMDCGRGQLQGSGSERPACHHGWSRQSWVAAPVPAIPWRTGLSRPPRCPRQDEAPGAHCAILFVDTLPFPPSSLLQ